MCSQLWAAAAAGVAGALVGSARAEASSAPAAFRGSTPTDPTRAARPVCAAPLRVRRAFCPRPASRWLQCPMETRPPVHRERLPRSAKLTPAARRTAPALPVMPLLPPRMEKAARRSRLAHHEARLPVEGTKAGAGAPPIPQENRLSAVHPCIWRSPGRRSGSVSAYPVRQRSSPGLAAAGPSRDSGNPTPHRPPGFGCSAWYPDRDRSGSPRSSRARSRPDYRHRAQGGLPG
jgi:hypothetical protein